MDCTRTITPAEIDSLDLAALPDGAILCFQPGVYKRKLVIEKPLTLRATDAGVILDGARRSPTLVVAKPVAVTVEGVTLRNGSGGAMGGGGNLFVSAAGEVVLRDVVLEGGEADANGGGGLFARAGTITLERCRLHKNRGKKAQAILVSGSAKLTLRDCVVADNQGKSAAVTAVGGARVTIERCVITNASGAALQADGMAGSGPEITVEKSIVGEIVVRSQAPAKIRVSGSALGKPLPVEAADGGENVVGELALDAQHRPRSGSIGEGRGPR